MPGILSLKGLGCAVLVFGGAPIKRTVSLKLLRVECASFTCSFRNKRPVFRAIFRVEIANLTGGDFIKPVEAWSLVRTLKTKQEKHKDWQIVLNAVKNGRQMT